MGQKFICDSFHRGETISERISRKWIKKRVDDQKNWTNKWMKSILNIEIYVENSVEIILLIHKKIYMEWQ